MKVKARALSNELAALDCKPWLGKPFTIYAAVREYAIGEGVVWCTMSGRKINKIERQAIDEVVEFYRFHGKTK